MERLVTVTISGAYAAVAGLLLWIHYTKENPNIGVAQWGAGLLALSIVIGLLSRGVGQLQGHLTMAAVTIASIGVILVIVA